MTCELSSDFSPIQILDSMVYNDHFVAKLSLVIKRGYEGHFSENILYECFQDLDEA